MTATVNIKVMTPSDDLVSVAEMLSRVLANSDPELLLTGLSNEPVSAVRLAGLTMAPEFELHTAMYSLTPVGMARLRTHPGQAPDAPAWYREQKVFAFDLLAVEPAMRGMGIATELLNHLEARAKQLGASELGCDVPETAQSTIEALARRGYRSVDRLQAGEGTRLVLSCDVSRASSAAA